MGTLKQKRVARRLVKVFQNNENITAGKILADVGYSAAIQGEPGRIINSPGVSEELTILGFSEQKAKEVVSEILGDTDIEPRDRLKAADLVFKVHGSFAPEKHANTNLNLNITTSNELSELATAMEEQLKLKKTQ